MKGKLILIFFLSFSTYCSFSQFSFDSIFDKDPFLKKISSNPVKYHLQVIYTQIDYENGRPALKDYCYRVEPENYFYCASLVKLPTSILALQKLNELGIKQNAIMFTDSSRKCHFKVTRDTSSASKYPNVEHYIKRMLLVSDNESFSRCYEFLGVDYIHEQLANLGFPGIRIINRYDGTCSGKDNFITNPVTFLDSNLKVIYRQEEQASSYSFGSPKKINVGKAYYDQNKKRINSPRDFTWSNYMELKDCHEILKELVFNEKKNLKITEEQRKFLLYYLSIYPRESMDPVYNPKTFYDSYKKYLYRGDSKKPITDTNLRITNIVGQSYGFMSDCAHFYDKANNIQFMLSAVIYADEDETLNDSKYDYKTIALPYLGELGRQFYEYELKRHESKEDKK